MLKKNQLALILLTLVLMLAVYFIRGPFGKEKPVDPITPPTSGRIEELQELRVILNEERTEAVLNLDSVIADNNASVDQKNAALEEKHYINNLTEKELLLEVQIINKGYRDAFVHASDTGVEITVVADQHSVSVANEIIKMAMTGFDKVFDNVTVQFSTAAEVMAPASGQQTVQ